MSVSGLAWSLTRPQNRADPTPRIGLLKFPAVLEVKAQFLVLPLTLAIFDLRRKRSLPKRLLVLLPHLSYP